MFVVVAVFVAVLTFTRSSKAIRLKKRAMRLGGGQAYSLKKKKKQFEDEYKRHSQRRKNV
jgi:hypothetical protein